MHSMRFDLLDFSRYVRNIGLSKFMATVEKATVIPHPDRPLETAVVKQVFQPDRPGETAVVKQKQVFEPRSSPTRTDQGRRP